ncbi:hypothetical protein AAA799D07_00239 [Marine Group I thaumarchaeote SCGC AAA799-D07]|nr:hypothetical protein AAA799D07_00239 [Marine Group I thaumarchaeote SCGC AAA799-D07]
MNMEPIGYELLKIETEISVLEKELTAIFEDYKKLEKNNDVVSENIYNKKLQKMNVCCIKLLETYRKYTNMLKNKK